MNQQLLHFSNTIFLLLHIYIKCGLVSFLFFFFCFVFFLILFLLLFNPSTCIIVFVVNLNTLVVCCSLLLLYVFCCITFTFCFCFFFLPFFRVKLLLSLCSSVARIELKLSIIRLFKHNVLGVFFYLIQGIFLLLLLSCAYFNFVCLFCIYNQLKLTFTLIK